MTVREWAECWLDLFPGNRNEETARNVEYQCAMFVRAYGSRRLSAVDPLLAQRWAVKHRSQVRFLRQMFGKAVKAGVVDVNVWRGVELPPGKAPKLPPTAAEFERIVAAARARGGWWDHFADCVIFTAHVGLRGLEVQGVATQDFLEAGRRLVVRGKRRPGEVEFRRRTVVVFGPAREAYERQRPSRGQVWRAMEGGPLTQDRRDRAFVPLAAEAGYAGTFHGLRHFCASWLLDNGASKVDVAIQLGHFDAHGRVDTTQIERVYGHMAVAPALDRLEAAIDQGGSDDGCEDVGCAGEDFAAALDRARSRGRGALRAGPVQA